MHEPCADCMTVHQKAQEILDLIHQQYGVEAKIEIRMHRLTRERANEMLLDMAQRMDEDEIGEFYSDSHQGHHWTTLKLPGWRVEITAHHAS